MGDKQNNNQVVITSSGIIDENNAFENINESNAGYAELTKLDHDQRPPDLITKTELGDELLIEIDQQRPPVINDMKPPVRVKQLGVKNDLKLPVREKQPRLNIDLKPPARDEEPPVLSSDDQFSLETDGWARPPIPPQQRNNSPLEDTIVVFHGCGLSRKTPGITQSGSTYKLSTSPGSSKAIFYNYELINRKNRISQTDRFTVTENNVYEIEVKFCTWKHRTAAVQLFKNKAVLHEFRADPNSTLDVNIEPGFRFSDPIDPPDLPRNPAAPVKKFVHHSFNVEEKLSQSDVLHFQLYSGTLVEQKSKEKGNSCFHFIVKKISPS